jgi:hypothetical protein
MEKKMFGGIGLLLNGNMAVGVEKRADRESVTGSSRVDVGGT